MAFVTGSYAYGTPTEASDVDLVVLVEGTMMGGLLADPEEVEEGLRNLSVALGPRAPAGPDVAPDGGMYYAADADGRPCDPFAAAIEDNRIEDNRTPAQHTRDAMADAGYPSMWGKLNLIMVTTEEEYQAWQDATEEMVAAVLAGGEPWVHQDAKLIIDKHYENLGISHLRRSGDSGGF